MPCAALAKLLAAFALALGLGLTAMLGTAMAEGADETHTTLLQPGLNPAGWTEPEADVAAIFEALPRLERVYGWDPDAQWFRWAARDASGLQGDLERLTPGMGLWLDIGGGGPAVWTRPLIAPSGLARLRPGWNFVVWTGPDGATVADALSELERDGILVGNAGARRYEPNGAPAPDGDAAPRTLTRGSPFWLRVSEAKQWWQLADAPRVEFVGEFSPSRQRELRDLVDEVVAWFINRFDLAVPGLTVRFGDADADIATECGGYANGTIYLKHPCFSAIAHEYSHALQEHLATTDHKSPAWLVEGVANRWSAQWHDARGDWTYENHRRVTVIPQAQQAAVSLRSMETGEGFLLEEGLGHATYSLAHLAADHLAELAGDDALFVYWEQRPRWPDWGSAFEDAFGISFELFYDSFEENRGEVAPPHPLVTGMLIDIAGNPMKNVEITLTTQETESSFYISITTDDTGFFSRRVPQDSYQASIWLNDSGQCMPDLQVGREDHQFRLFHNKLVYELSNDIIISESNAVDASIRLPFEIKDNCSQVYGTVNVAGSIISIEEVSSKKIVDTFEVGKVKFFTYGLTKGVYKISSIVRSVCHEERTGEREITIHPSSETIDRFFNFDVPTIWPCPPVEGIVLGPDLQPLSGILVLAHHSLNTMIYSSLSNSDGMFRVIPPHQHWGHYYRIQFRAGQCSLGWYDSDTGRMTDDMPAARIGVHGDVTASIVAHVRFTSCNLAGHVGNTRLFVPDYRPAR